jgi:menaquinol-cytochrome c reductase cytochrome b/c subunit
MAETETKGNKYEAGFSSDAKKEPVRVVFITKKTSAKVIGDPGPQMMTYPHLLVRESITFMVLVIVLVAVALFWDAPLEQLANPLLTPNPAKAPWYFLGLQELLHYFPPLVAGIIIPTLVVIALVVVPYFNINIQGAPLWSKNPKPTLLIFVSVVGALSLSLVLFHAWTVLVPTVIVALLVLASYPGTVSKSPRVSSWWRRERPLSWWVMTWFISVAVVLTVVGTFFRGPGWSWVWPWSSHAG